MIEVSNISKYYGPNPAVLSLSFTAEKGKVYGFLGPNGAGKSTSMNIMTGCLSADSGTVRIDGLDIYRDAETARKKIGFLPEVPPLYADMTPYEFLRFVAEAKGLSGVYAENAVSKVMAQTEISDRKDRLIKNLSKGYRQRVGIAQALIGDPDVILLDEPMVGLDPRQVSEMRALILSLKEDRTVIISSHILSEIQEICDSLIIISKGRLVAQGSLDEISDKFIETKSISLRVRGDAKKLSMLLECIDALRSYTLDEQGEYVCAHIEYEKGTEIAEQLSGECARSGLPVSELRDTTMSLEDVFLKLTEEPESTDEPQDAGEDPDGGEDGPDVGDDGEDDDYKPLFGQ